MWYAWSSDQNNFDVHRIVEKVGAVGRILLSRRQVCRVGGMLLHLITQNVEQTSFICVGFLMQIKDSQDSFYTWICKDECSYIAIKIMIPLLQLCMYMVCCCTRKVVKAQETKYATYFVIHVLQFLLWSNYIPATEFCIEERLRLTTRHILSYNSWKPWWKEVLNIKMLTLKEWPDPSSLYPAIYYAHADFKNSQHHTSQRETKQRQTEAAWCHHNLFTFVNTLKYLIFMAFICAAIKTTRKYNFYHASGDNLAVK